MYLSAKICGTPIRKGGFIPIVNINDAAFDVADIYSAAVSSEREYYTFAVLPRLSVFKLIFTHISTPGSSFAAPVVVCISVPRGYALPQGVSPCLVLSQLKDAFLAQFAMPKDECGDWYEYSIKTLDTEPLEAVCSAYPLEAVADDGYSMDINGPRAALDADYDTISAVMAQDTHSDVFAPYSEIILAPRVNNAVVRHTISLNDIIRPLEEESPQPSDSKPFATDDGSGKDNGTPLAGYTPFSDAPPFTASASSADSEPFSDSASSADSEPFSDSASSADMHVAPTPIGFESATPDLSDAPMSDHDAHPLDAHNSPKSGKKTIAFLIFILILLAGALAYFILRSPDGLLIERDIVQEEVTVDTVVRVDTLVVRDTVRVTVPKPVTPQYQTKTIEKVSVDETDEETEIIEPLPQQPVMKYDPTQERSLD